MIDGMVVIFASSGGGGIGDSNNYGGRTGTKMQQLFRSAGDQNESVFVLWAPR